MNKLDKSKCCCFTGPRPEKINDNINEISNLLREEITKSIHQGYIYFFTGMSRGIDLLAAQVVLSLQNEYDIHLIAAIPFINQEISWPKEDQELYYEILKKVRFSFHLSNNFHKLVYHLRNKFMVNNSSKVIAYYKNTNGGTKYTLDYAEKCQIEIVNIADNQLNISPID